MVGPPPPDPRRTIARPTGYRRLAGRWLSYLRYCVIVVCSSMTLVASINGPCSPSSESALS
ncbi:hypothetical protein LAUMK41_00871 [Mycobacterium attenuatum]|nr:hypothetical protein LAUMK41_00871 [Mycobacterium attenuatum]